MGSSSIAAQRRVVRRRRPPDRLVYHVVLLCIALAGTARLVIAALSKNPYVALTVGSSLVPYVIVTAVLHRTVRRTLRTLENGGDLPSVSLSEWVSPALAAAGLSASCIS